MQAVILAAGRGTRMGKLTIDLPKSLLKINGKPIVEYTLENLPTEIDEIIFLIGYKGEKIKKYFGNFWQGKKIIYVEQKELNGTGGAISLVKNLVRDKFLVLMADDLYHKKDIAKLLNYEIALLAKEIENNTKFGVIETDETGNFLKDIVEFNNTKHRYVNKSIVNVGVYILNQNFFKYPLIKISEKEFGLPQTLAQMANTNQIKIIEAKYWHPNNQPDDLTKGESIIGIFKK